MYKLIILLSLFLFLLFSACGSNSDSHQHADDQPGEHSPGETASANAPAKFRSQLSSAINIYFELKDALVAADSKLALEKANAFKTSLSKVDIGELSGDILEHWKENLSDLQDKVAAQISKEDIEAQRAAFSPLSESLAHCVEEFGPLDMVVYVQHCPMANDNAGGDWLSAKKEVFNPYFGEGMMYNCGSVKKTFAQK